MIAAPDPAEKTLSGLLRLLGREVSSEVIDELFLSHPDYPSLAAFSDALLGMGVPHEALQVPRESLRELALPHLAHLDNEDFVVVERLEDGRVDLAGRGSLPLEQYLRLWSGVVLVPERDKPSSQASASPRPALSAGLGSALASALWLVVVAGLAAWSSPPSGAWLGLLGLTVLGLVASALLTAESLGLQTAAQRFCSLSQKTSCASVLASRAARLGPFSMADIGLGYFAGGLLVLLVAWTHPSAAGLAVFALTGLAALGLPYTAFSVVYQGVVVKRWCPLCLLVQLVLWGEALLGLGAGAWAPGARHDPTAWAVIALFPLPFALWVGVKPWLERSLRLRGERIEHERLIRDPVIIRTLVELEPAAELPPVPLEIRSGPSEAPVTVTIYTDPTCSFCRERHLELEEAARSSPEGLRVEVRLLGPMHADEASWGLIRALAQDLAAERHADAHARLSRWFHGDRTVAPVRDLSPGAAALLERHREVQAHPPFGATPVVFVGGRRWPSRLPLRVVAHWARAQLEG